MAFSPLLQKTRHPWLGMISLTRATKKMSNPQKVVFTMTTSNEKHPST